ncbi:MAG: DUF86 domain-containing protein [Leptospiraceae bacterium]|nr:DUF86 domain-containing protein [Leptospiraceae bacterium]
MSQHEDKLYIEDMKSFSNEALELINGLSKDDLKKNRVLQLALVKLLENIGEASTKVSSPFKEQNPNFPWAEIKGMRNRLVHGYNKINLEIVFNTCVNDLPSLLTELEKLSK